VPRLIYAVFGMGSEPDSHQGLLIPAPLLVPRVVEAGEADGAAERALNFSF